MSRTFGSKKIQNKLLRDKSRGILSDKFVHPFTSSLHQDARYSQSLNKKNVKLIIVVLLTFLFFVGIIIRFRISAIDCRFRTGDCSSELKNYINSVKLGNYFFSKARLNTVLSKSSLISNYSIRFKFPDKLVVSVIEKKPFAAIYNDTDKKLGLIDREGTFLSTGTEKTLPRIIIDTPFPNPGELVSEEIKFATILTARTSQIYTITTARLTEELLEIKLGSGQTIYFPVIGDQELLAGSLVAIVTRLNKQGENTIIENDSPIGTQNVCINGCIIDLRFKNPVIRSS